LSEAEPDPEERAAIVAEWKRLAAEPPPTNPRPYGRAYARAQEALAWLVANPESQDAEARRHNAVALIFNTVVWDGPTVSTTIDPAQSREKLGASLPYVLGIERALVAELKIPAILAERSGTLSATDARG
jgi:hypothetical protein